jgi:hypothetical protein
MDSRNLYFLLDDPIPNRLELEVDLRRNEPQVALIYLALWHSHMNRCQVDGETSNRHNGMALVSATSLFFPECDSALFEVV